jgi:exodeoxyribonuclease III
LNQYLNYKMKIISYNLNGIRAAITKGLPEWLLASNPDIFCVQELKSTQEQVDESFLLQLGYKSFWYPAEKKGYSGVGIFTKLEPINVVFGCGMPAYDVEGRVIRLDFSTFSIMNVYMPSGSSGDERQNFKFQWMKDFYGYIQNMLQEIPNLIIVGDFNICHQPIDIHNPISNAKSSGFLPEERVWLGKLFELGFIDTFRFLNPEPHNYTWWSYRANARSKNLGWRIDYQIVSENLKDSIKRALILSEAKHSDHCPTFLEMEL